MRTKTVMTALALVAAVAVAQEMHLAVGSEAPAFEGKFGEKSYSLKELGQKGPVYVLFWKERCPHNGKASAIYNKLNAAFKDKVNFVGIVSTTPERAALWAEKFSVNYPLLADAEKSVIKAYKLKPSICAFKIEDGKIAEVFGGYGKASIDALNKSMAAAAKSTPTTLDGLDVPAGRTWG